MNTKERLVEMKNQLMLMFDDAIANYDKAIERQNSDEWKEYADEWDMDVNELEMFMKCSEREVDKLVDTINGELSAFEEAAEWPFEKFI